MVNKSVLVVGAGISGLTAAIEAAETGFEVFLVEKEAYLGGRVARMNQYFPKLCPPNCGLEINFRRIRSEHNLRFLTSAEVVQVAGQEGDFTVAVRQNPRFVNENCTACNKCAEVCPVERSNEFNYDLDKTRAAYLPHSFAFPTRYVIDGKACLGEKCGKCVEACAYEAIELKMQAREVTLKVGAIVWATGWEPYDAGRISAYGFGRFPNVVTNVIMERLASPLGPTGGRIVRPSDGKEVQKVAFVQCAGSRDENHLPFCSSVCCLASLKQATYVLNANPGAQVAVYYIDIRALGKFEDFFAKVQLEPNVTLIKGKPGEILEDGQTGDVIVVAEDQLARKITQERYDLVVLATGMAPSAGAQVPLLGLDDRGFVAPDQVPGIYGAGCVKRPLDVASAVQDATSAALKAIQSTVRRQLNG
ncbi:MAG: CoB--CoM heterodisulfide reductase iron-sulfur subunit A family protein [Peptococcaceae bacterium]|jgi:quinone-modifying oxidoreductase subunit QmoA|nr:CoB--CoM heterodisulfide reductase iron-sulfur subunit A family protein [Peptococcaceae bacterium]